MASVFLRNESGDVRKVWASDSNVRRFDFLEGLTQKGLVGVTVNGKYLAYAPSAPLRVFSRRIHAAFLQPSLFGAK